jgi:pimeloyl-ACP methyl ester carboxylesterase
LTAIRHSELVRKLVVASVTFNTDGFHPGLMEGLDQLQPEHMAGTPWQQEYATIAPRPEDWPRLVGKIKEMNRHIPNLSDQTIRSIKAPTLVIIGDSDIIRPEHAVEMFRLLGGGISGDTPAGLPNSQLAVLPGTSHTMVVGRADWLVSMITEFLDAPMPEAS